MCWLWNTLIEAVSSNGEILQYDQNVVAFGSQANVYDHTLGNAPHPVPNCEAKPQWAHLVLGWGTTRESCGVVRVFLISFFALPSMWICVCSLVVAGLALLYLHHFRSPHSFIKSIHTPAAGNDLIPFFFRDHDICKVCWIHCSQLNRSCLARFWSVDSLFIVHY